MALELERAREDLGAFSEAIGQPLAPWQAQVLALERRTTTLVAPRQSGKSRSLAVLALHRAFRRPGQLVLIVSAGEDAARRLLASAARMAFGSRLLAGSVVDETAALLTLSNGSQIRSVPASERQVRGWTADLLLVDEAALVDERLLLEAAIPTTAARPDARIVLAGSPGAAEGAFYGFFVAGERGSEHVASYRWELTNAAWIAAHVIESAREQLPPAAFEREYLGHFADVDGDERVIEREWIERARQREGELAEEVVFGLDVARRGGDESVLTAVSGSRAWVVWAVRGLDLMSLTGRVVATIGKAPVWVDGIGLGAGVVDRLNELGCRVVDFQAASRSSDPRRYLNLRSESWWWAREVLRDGLVSLDADDRVLASQLGAVRYRLASSGGLQIEAKDQMRSSPDRADSLVIALWGARQSSGASRWGQLVRSLLATSKPHPLLAYDNPEPLGLWRGARNELEMFDEVVPTRPTADVDDFWGLRW